MWIAPVAEISSVLSEPPPPIDQVVQKMEESLFEFLRENHPEIDLNEVRLVFFQREIWNNGALGWPEEGKMYTQALVSGYSLAFQAGELRFVVHTNEQGSIFLVRSYAIHTCPF